MPTVHKPDLRSLLHLATAPMRMALHNTCPARNHDLKKKILKCQMKKKKPSQWFNYRTDQILSGDKYREISFLLDKAKPQ